MYLSTHTNAIHVQQKTFRKIIDAARRRTIPQAAVVAVREYPNPMSAGFQVGRQEVPQPHPVQRSRSPRAVGVACEASHGDYAGTHISASRSRPAETER